MNKTKPLKIRMPSDRKLTQLRLIPNGDLNRTALASSVSFSLDIFENPKIDPERTYRKLVFNPSDRRMNVFHIRRVEVVRLEEVGRRIPMDLLHLNWFLHNQSDWKVICPTEVNRDSVTAYFPGILMTNPEFPDYEFCPHLGFNARSKTWIAGYTHTEAMARHAHLPSHLVAVI